MKKKKLTVVDLFCGGGIGAVGVISSNLDIIYALDNNKYAVETYNKNIQKCCIQQDIRTLDITTIPDSDIILGSPVCKSFSFAGNNNGFSDEKYGDLTSYYLRIIKYKKPKALVFENVKGMISKKHKPYFDGFLDELRAIGYSIHYKVLNAFEYGVPQVRERLIVVGIRNDIKDTFTYPEVLDSELRMNIYDAIGDLPEPSKVMNSNNDIQFTSNANYPNHSGYGIRKDEKPFISKIPSGGNWKCLDDESAKSFLGKAYYNGGGRTGFLRKVDINKPSYTITSTMNGKNNAQIIDGNDLILKDKEELKIYNQDIYYDNGYSSRYLSRNRQRQWNEPSFTIISGARQLPLYPEPKNYDIRKIDTCEIAPPRRFTVRECLRLQSVPDWYVIDEAISLTKQYEIVGNGIPSLLLFKIFNQLKLVLEQINWIILFP